MLLNSLFSETFLTLDSEELKFVQSNNTEKNRLAFAVMLKFFQTKGRYPTKKDTIEPMILHSLATQLKVSPFLFEPIYLEIEPLSDFVRKYVSFLGYRIATLSDAKILIAWLIEQAKNGPYTLPQYREKANQFFIENKLEPFTPERTDRYIRSAIHRFEKQFFADIAKQLSPESVKLANDLLCDDTKTNGSKKDNTPDDEITLRRLKADIAGVKLKHVAFEIKKLNFIRSITNPIIII